MRSMFERQRVKRESKMDIAFWVMVILAFAYGIGSTIEIHSDTPEKPIACQEKEPT